VIVPIVVLVTRGGGREQPWPCLVNQGCWADIRRKFGARRSILLFLLFAHRFLRIETIVRSVIHRSSEALAETGW